METKAGVGTWAITAVSAVAGGVALQTATPALLGLLAATGIGLPTITLGLGALGGGMAGWNYMRRRAERKAVEVVSA